MSAESRLDRFLDKVNSFVSGKPAQVELSDELKEQLPDGGKEALLKEFTEGEQVGVNMEDDSEKPVMFVDEDMVENSGTGY